VLHKSRRYGLDGGAIFHPNFYREYIFPRYKELWKPLKEKGIKVIFCSDGNFTEFIDDIVDAGADGFIFEPLSSLEYHRGEIREDAYHDRQCRYAHTDLGK